MASSGQIIEVDVDALLVLAGRVQTAKAALADDAGMFADGGNGIEHSRLRSTVDDFDSRWSDKRHQIVDALDKTGSAMRTVAESFSDVDDELAKGVLGTGEVGSAGTGKREQGRD